MPKGERSQSECWILVISKLTVEGSGRKTRSVISAGRRERARERQKGKEKKRKLLVANKNLFYQKYL